MNIMLFSKLCYNSAIKGANNGKQRDNRPRYLQENQKDEP